MLEVLPAWVGHEHLVYVERPVERGGHSLNETIATVPGARLMKQGSAARVAFGLLRLAGAE